jgi:hypothetical protein
MLEVSVNARNVEVMATTTQMNGGYLRIYGGSRPSAPEVAVTTQVLFCSLRFGNPAFGFPEDGTATANPFEGAADILAGGFPVWFRAFAADGTTAVLDGDIGSDLVLSQPVLAQGGTFSVTSLTYSRP